MKFLLRVIAFVVGLAVAVTALMVVRFASTMGLGRFMASGTLGLLTVLLWGVILIAGPLAAIQLWRFRRIGLVLSVMLCGLACGYYIAGTVALRSPSAALAPIVEAVGFNALIIVVLLTPSARRICK